MPFAHYLLALVVFAMGTSEIMLAGLVSDISIYFGFSFGTAGLLPSAFVVGMVIGAPAMAVLTGRFPVKVTLLGCAILFALSHVVGVLTPDFSVLFITRVVAAIVNAGLLAVVLSAATKLVAPDAKGRAMAYLLAGSTLPPSQAVPRVPCLAQRSVGNRRSGRSL